MLSNPGGAARVEWRPFSRFAPVPEGAVAAAEDAFVGRARDEGPSFLPGSIALDGRSLAFDQMTVFLRHISSSSSSSSVPAGPVARLESSGEVMVEVEPERYELHVEQSGGRWGSKAKVRMARHGIMTVAAAVVLVVVVAAAAAAFAAVAVGVVAVAAAVAVAAVVGGVGVVVSLVVTAVAAIVAAVAAAKENNKNSRIKVSSAFGNFET